MGNRPINRRPFKRPPWRTKKRPTRWNAVSNGLIEDGFAQATLVPFAYGGSQPAAGPLAILVDGQVDVEPWADEQEVTLDRIVGTLIFAGRSQVLSPGFFPPPVLLKLGICLNEELTDESPAPLNQKAMFEQESLEDTEWMWLHSVVLEPQYDTQAADGSRAEHFRYNVPVDIRNRRKIGQKDELALYGMCTILGSYTPPWDIQVQSYTDVRCILMSR